MDGLDSPDSGLLRCHRPHLDRDDCLAGCRSESATTRVLADPHDAGRSPFRGPAGERLPEPDLDLDDRGQPVDRTRPLRGLDGGGHAVGLGKEKEGFKRRWCQPPSHRRRPPGQPGKEIEGEQEDPT